MHLTFGNVVLYTPLYRLTERKRGFHVHNCPCGTVGANIGYMLGLLVDGKIVVEFSRKVFIVDCLLLKTLNVAKKCITEHAQTFSCTKTPSVTIQGNITATKYRTDVIRLVLLLHIRANLGMMLARDNASCDAARNTLVMIVANSVRSIKWPAKVLI